MYINIIESWNWVSNNNYNTCFRKIKFKFWIDCVNINSLTVIALLFNQWMNYEKYCLKKRSKNLGKKSKNVSIFEVNIFTYVIFFFFFFTPSRILATYFNFIKKISIHMWLASSTWLSTEVSIPPLTFFFLPLTNFSTIQHWILSPSSKFLLKLHPTCNQS